MCAGSHKVTSSKTNPLHPQTTSAKGTITPTDSTNGVSPSQQAVESIRRLYTLTFQDRQKAQNDKLKLEGETEEEGKREAGAAKEEAVTVGSSPFQSLRKSFKMSPKRRVHGESRKRSALSESSSESPRRGSNPIVRRKTVSGGRLEKPKFYLRDLLPLLQERNELKEQVHLLECEVESLKRCSIDVLSTLLAYTIVIHFLFSECGRLRVANSSWVNQHNWSRMLVDIPEEVQTLSESPPVDNRPRATTMRLQ